MKHVMMMMNFQKVKKKIKIILVQNLKSLKIKVMIVVYMKKIKIKQNQMMRIQYL